MYTRYGVELLQRQAVERDDEGALDCLCSEYNCPCHDLVPKLLDDLVALHEALSQVYKVVDQLPIRRT
jgi:hypothetical protein